MVTAAGRRMRIRSLAARTVVRGRQVTAHWRGLPDTLIIGTQRGGTTSLYKYLEGHPDLVASRRKETDYFSMHHGRGERWYRAHFPTGDHRSFEATPYYLFHPHAPTRAAALVPNARIVVLLREPMARAVSHHQHLTRLGHESLSFDDAVRAEPERLAGELDRMLADPTYDSIPHRRFSYVARGVYAPQVERWLEHFPRERVLFLESEDLFARPDLALAEVLGFLDLRPWQPQELKNWSRVGMKDPPSPPRVLPETASLVEAEVGPSNARLAELTGRQLSWLR